MKLLNIGCGEVQPPAPWVNVDRDPNTGSTVMHHDLNAFPWPWENDTFDGIAASHIFEHLDAHQLQRVVEECYRVLLPGGILRVTVPNASYFRAVYDNDNRECAEVLFGEPIRHPGYETFTGWALFLYDDHRQVFTEDSLWMTLVNREYPPTKKVSFLPSNVRRTDFKKTAFPDHYCALQVAEIDCRPKFSLFMEAVKQ